MNARPSPAPRPPLFGREHPRFVPGNLPALIHVADEVLLTGEGVASPAVPALLAAAVYVFVPRPGRAVLALGLGGIWAFAQITGHVIPILRRGHSAREADHTAIFPIIGGPVLLALGVRLLRPRAAV